MTGDHGVRQSPAGVASRAGARRRGVAAALIACATMCALTRGPAGAQTAAAPAAFGQPPAGDVPILFNDRHVYAKPDRLKRNRVLAALVRGNTILVPLRSMFEQTGATVSFDRAAKTVDVSKPGSDVRLTVGRPEVVINGEARPLDVAPEIDGGIIFVPLRVISEGMGAYVQWLPERRTVVVRYVAAPAPPPPPTPAPVSTLAPTPQPTATPALPTAPRARHEHYVVGDYLFDPKVYNAFSPGNKGVGTSYGLHGALEFSLFGLPWMLAGDYRSYHYPHNSGSPTAPGDPGRVTVIGGYGQTFVPAFVARESDFDGRFGFKLVDPRIYIGIGYLHRENEYGYPKQNGVGYGVEKLPDLEHHLSLYGSAYYYPNATGDFVFDIHDPYVDANRLYGTTGKLADRFLKYRVGATIVLAGTRGEYGMFLDGGYLGDSIRVKSLSPADAAHEGAYLGLGLKF